MKLVVQLQGVKESLFYFMALSKYRIEKFTSYIENLGFKLDCFADYKDETYAYITKDGKLYECCEYDIMKHSDDESCEKFFMKDLEEVKNG